MNRRRKPKTTDEWSKVIAVLNKPIIHEKRRADNDWPELLVRIADGQINRRKTSDINVVRLGSGEPEQPLAPQVLSLRPSPQFL